MTYVSIPKFTPATTAPTNNNTNHGARSKAKTHYKQKGRGGKSNSCKCTICDTEVHYYDECSIYTLVTEKRSAMKVKGRCEDCGAVKRADHYCYLPYLCRFCGGKHREPLCENKGKNQQKQER